MKHGFEKALATGLAFFACSSGTWASADIFANIPFAQAKQEAQRDGKFLLVDFMASWCPPCKKMEATTWIDETVKSWIKENAIAIQVDVDKDEKTSSELKISAMPTLVLFSPQSLPKEFGRQDGYLSASELMLWLNGAKSGKTPEQMEKELSQSNDTQIWEHLGKARAFDAAGKGLDALSEYIWIWKNVSRDAPNTGEVRNFMVSHEMKEIAKKVPEAKIQISELRDAAEKSSDKFDWILLNGVLEDNQKTLAWFDKIKSDPTQKSTIKSCSRLLESVLCSSGRWADAATYLFSDPLACLQEYYKKAEAMKHPGPHTEVSKSFDPLPSMVLLLYGSYLGAGRDAEAQKIADECLRLDNTEEMKKALENMASGMKNAVAAQKPGSKTAGETKPHK